MGFWVTVVEGQHAPKMAIRRIRRAVPRRKASSGKGVYRCPSTYSRICCCVSKFRWIDWPPPTVLLLHIWILANLSSKKLVTEIHLPLDKVGYVHSLQFQTRLGLRGTFPMCYSRIQSGDQKISRSFLPMLLRYKVGVLLHISLNSKTQVSTVVTFYLIILARCLRLYLLF